ESTNSLPILIIENKATMSCKYWPNNASGTQESFKIKRIIKYFQDFT
ncbi:unnamed protein product, partial [marine sediment metagenome]